MTADFRPTRLTVDYGVIGDNMRALRAFFGPGLSVMAVVKANAYGHGAVPVTREVLRAGADRIAVAVVEEALELRDAGVSAPILVLGGARGAGVREAVHAGVTLALEDRMQAEEFRLAARAEQKPALVHVKIDTGMNRLGVRGESELRALVDAIGTDGLVCAEGAFTHYCAPDDRAFTLMQHERFCSLARLLPGAGAGLYLHSAATEAAICYPETRDNGVRPGIALYGGCAEYVSGLRWAMRLTSRAARISRIEAGESVGYGRTFVADRPTVVMTVPIGYADGYPRALGGRAFALVRGRRAPVIGRVCMDMLMLDVTDIPGVSMDDEIVLLGAQGDDEITPEELACLADTISYEIITGFHERIARRDLYDKSRNPGFDP